METRSVSQKISTSDPAPLQALQVAAAPEVQVQQEEILRLDPPAALAVARVAAGTYSDLVATGQEVSVPFIQSLQPGLSS